MLQASYQTNFYLNNVQIKVGLGVVRKNWSAYAYMPYLNYNIEARGYNTPLSFEGFWKNKISLNFDIYKDFIIPSIRFKIKIL